MPVLRAFPAQRNSRPAFIAGFRVAKTVLTFVLFQFVRPVYGPPAAGAGAPAITATISMNDVQIAISRTSKGFIIWVRRR